VRGGKPDAEGGIMSFLAGRYTFEKPLGKRANTLLLLDAVTS